jgi:hypothetical protein
LLLANPYLAIGGPRQVIGPKSLPACGAIETALPRHPVRGPAQAGVRKLCGSASGLWRVADSGFRPYPAVREFVGTSGVVELTG